MLLLHACTLLLLQTFCATFDTSRTRADSCVLSPWQVSSLITISSTAKSRKVAQKPGELVQQLQL